MSKIFMYGTELQELEKLMMIVPNFIPRKSGVVVMNRINHGEEEMLLKRNCKCDDFNSDRSQSKKLLNEVLSGDMDYEAVIQNCFEKCSSLSLNSRLKELIENYEGDIFLSVIHQSRFEMVCRLHEIPNEKRNPNYLAALFLLTADIKLWHATKDYIYKDSFDFKRMRLNGINTDGYAIYQTARTISSAKEYIKLDEIADRNLIGNLTFKVIIHAILIAKHGASMFQLRW